MSAELDVALDRPLPQDEDAERAVIGAVLINNEAFWRVQGDLKADDFFKDAHRLLWRTAEKMLRAGEAVDFLTLKSVVAGKIERPYITSLVDGIPDSANVERYARIVVEKSKLRRLIKAGNALMRAALDTTSEPETIAIEAITKIGEASTRADRRARPMFEYMVEVQAQSDDRVKNGLPPSLITGIFPTWDSRQALRSTLIQIGGPSNHGKTTLAINTWLALGRNGYTALFASLESTEKEVVSRSLSTITKVPHSRINKWSELNEADRWAMSEATKWMRTKRLFLTRRTRTFEALYAECRRLKSTEGLNAVLLDYIQVLRFPGGPRDREERLAEMSQHLLEMAIDLDIAVICTSQLNKERHERADGRILQSDLKYAAAIGESARVVILFQRPWVDDKANNELRRCGVKFQLEKNNEGTTGDFEGHFDDITQTFSEGGCAANRCRLVAVRDQQLALTGE